MTPANPSNPAASDLVALFRAHGGQLRLSDALAHGGSRYQFYKLRDQGVIERVSRGTYRLTELPSVSDPDLLAVATRFPKAVLCLVSALAWHDMTTQIPRRIDLAVARNARLPKLDYPPVRGYRFSGRRFTSGVETPPWMAPPSGCIARKRRWPIASPIATPWAWMWCSRRSGSTRSATGRTTPGFWNTPISAV